MSNERAFFESVAARGGVRIRVAGIVVAGDRVLVQRPSDDPGACHAFVGGEYEWGDTFESRLIREFEEETTARVVRCAYRFVVEHRFEVGGRPIHALEHYLEAEIDRVDVSSREAGLTFCWLPLGRLGDYDLRPHVVRDAVASGVWRTVRHLVSEPAN